MTPSLLPPECLGSSAAFYFGTFNPIHCGHLMIAQAVLEQFRFEKIVFVPAGSPPLRQNERDMLQAQDRLKMVELAISDNAGFTVDPLELEREGPSYTVDTLSLIREKYGLGSACMPFIIGADALAGLPRWYRPRDIIDQVCFLQAPRPEQPEVFTLEIEGETVPISTIRVDMPEIGISSTLVRKWLEAGRNVRYFIPDKVRAYLQENRLFMPSQRPTAM